MAYTLTPIKKAFFRCKYKFRVSTSSWLQKTRICTFSISSGLSPRGRVFSPFASHGSAAAIGSTRKQHQQQQQDPYSDFKMNIANKKRIVNGVVDPAQSLFHSLAESINKLNLDDDDPIDDSGIELIIQGYEKEKL